MVEKGPDRGRRIVLPESGARIGRASANDVVLTDPALSRFHCRVYFKPDGGLAVADLGSTNDTLVNGKPVQDMPLRNGDVIAIGETALRVIHDRRLPPAGEPADVSSTGSPTARSGPPVKRRPHVRPPIARVAAWSVVGLALALAAAAVLLKQTAFWPWGAPVSSIATLPAIFIEYEKVQATASNIFRYAVRLEDQTLAVRIDSLAEARQVAREKRVDRETVRKLGAAIERAGFFDLQPTYEGVARDTLDAMDIEVTLGTRTHRSRVANRLEPEAFAEVRAIIETYAQNELGLAALALSPEQLVERARDALRAAEKFYDDREVRFGNLASAIRSFQECVWHLETVEPKPDFHRRAVAGIEDAKRALQEKFEDQQFRAERAIKLRDWTESARALRTILDLIPDAADSRHQWAREKLLDVERHADRKGSRS